MHKLTETDRQTHTHTHRHTQTHTDARTQKTHLFCFKDSLVC